MIHAEPIRKERDIFLYHAGYASLVCLLGFFSQECQTKTVSYFMTIPVCNDKY